MQRRTVRLQSQDELNAFFASDPLALKTREIIEKLREINDNVKADDIDARLKASRDQAIRVLRDKTDIFEDGGNIIKLGRHRFSVNTQELDLTILPKNDQLWVYLTGTDFQEPIENAELSQLRPYWSASLESESDTVYRSEYLAYSIIYAATKRQDGLDFSLLKSALTSPEKLEKIVRDFASPRYKEGYEKGIHDHDAVALLKKLLPIGENADLLRYNPTARAIAAIYWEQVQNEDYPAQWYGTRKNGNEYSPIIP